MSTIAGAHGDFLGNGRQGSKEQSSEVGSPICEMEVAVARRPSVPTRFLSPFDIIEANEPAFAHWLQEHRHEEVECALRGVARDGRLYGEELEREGTGAHGARLSKREMELRRAIDYGTVRNSVYGRAVDHRIMA
ncbi:MAG TPA: hypothetical protein VK196_18620 [Magnetospirillum sp.]|nr:hypothetical protein [Magnetospirillum sp.]